MTDTIKAAWRIHNGDVPQTWTSLLTEARVIAGAYLEAEKELSFHRDTFGGRSRDLLCKAMADFDHLQSKAEKAEMQRDALAAALREARDWLWQYGVSTKEFIAKCDASLEALDMPIFPISRGLPDICPACGKGEDAHSYSQFGRICKKGTQ